MDGQAGDSHSSCSETVPRQQGDAIRTDVFEGGEIDGWNQLKHVRSEITMATCLGCFNDKITFTPPMSLTTAESAVVFRIGLSQCNALSTPDCYRLESNFHLSGGIDSEGVM